MGYLGDKTRRRRRVAGIRAASLRASRSAASRADLTPLGRWIPVNPSASLPRDTYLRFAVQHRDSFSHREQGVFQAVSRLERAVPLGPGDLRVLKTTLQWFNRNLAVPRDVPAQAIFWFKSDAAECLDRIMDLVSVLQKWDVVVLGMECSHPGRIVYEDDQQIGAIPFRDRQAERWRV